MQPKFLLISLLSVSTEFTASARNHWPTSPKPRLPRPSLPGPTLPTPQLSNRTYTSIKANNKSTTSRNSGVGDYISVIMHAGLWTRFTNCLYSLSGIQLQPAVSVSSLSVYLSLMQKSVLLIIKAIIHCLSEIRPCMFGTFLYTTYTSFFPLVPVICTWRS